MAGREGDIYTAESMFESMDSHGVDSSALNYDNIVALGRIINSDRRPARRGPLKRFNVFLGNILIGTIPSSLKPNQPANYDCDDPLGLDAPYGVEPDSS